MISQTELGALVGDFISMALASLDHPTPENIADARRHLVTGRNNLRRIELEIHNAHSGSPELRSKVGQPGAQAGVVPRPAMTGEAA